MAENVIYLSNVRLSFPHIAEPQVNKESGKISYNAEFIMPADHPGFQQFMQAVYALAAAKWNEHASNVLQMVNQDRKKRCYGQGAEKVNQKTFQPYDGYAGNVFITAGRDKQPQIILPSGAPVDPANTMAASAEARRLYGGCRVNVALKPWLQDNKHGRGVRCDLVAIQFAGDDAPFGEGAVDVSPMFGAVAGAPAGAPTPGGMPAWGAPAPAPQMPPAPTFGAPGVPSFLQ